MKKFALIAALLALSPTLAVAQTSGTDAETPAIATPDSNNPDAPVPGKNSFTENQARERIADAQTLADRIARLTELRMAEGYMASWWQEEDGHFILVENHCPICAAATACRNFCRSELDIFRAVLDAPVERTEHLLQGARRCAYRIG